jgi:hypothetical protein
MVSMLARLSSPATIAALSWLLGTLHPAGAIVIRHDRSDARYQELGSQYKSVCAMNLPGGEGTLIAADWILSAAHVVKGLKPEHSVSCGGTSHKVSRVVVFPGGQEGRDDIALVKLERPVEGVSPVPLYRGREELPKQVTFVGRGGTGTGLTGAQTRDGVLRGATNQVYKVAERHLVFRFDEPPGGTDLEGVSGPGDSGGPAFLEIEGTTCLAGISSGQDHRAQGKEGVYGVLEFYTRVSSYLEWIDGHLGVEAHPPLAP